MSLGARLLERLGRDPDRVILEGDGGRHTRREVAHHARRVAAALRDAGVAPGDRVVLSLPKTVWLPACHVGALALGAVVVPLNPAYPDAVLAELVARAEPSLAIADPALAARAPELAPRLPWWCPEGDPPPGATALPEADPTAAPAPLVDAAAPALLVFTSGTTGTPKGVVLSHGNLAHSLAGLERVWGWRQDDRLLHVLPVFHLHGLGVALYGSLAVGSTLVFHERFDPLRVLREAGPARATLLMAVPTMLRRLVEAAASMPGNPLAGLRAVISGSAPLPPALFRRFRERFGLEPVERYGMTETMMNASNSVAESRTPGSVGWPLPGVEIGLRDPQTGADAGAGPGEVWIRGPNVFAGYWRDPEATRAAFDREGWFRTGDLGLRDEAGRLHLTGRVKEIILTGGYNVSPVAVEEALAGEEDPDVVELAVAGVADPDLGERVVAFVVPGAEADWQALTGRLAARAEARLPRYARPRHYLRRDALPRGPLGKVERGRLADVQGGGESP